MMCVEVTVVPQCRVGLAPTVSVMSRLAMLRRRLESGAVGGDDRIPFAAGGDDGVQLAQDRRGDDSLSLSRNNVIPEVSVGLHPLDSSLTLFITVIHADSPPHASTCLFQGNLGRFLVEPQQMPSHTVFSFYGHMGPFLDDGLGEDT